MAITMQRDLSGDFCWVTATISQHLKFVICKYNQFLNVVWKKNQFSLFYLNSPWIEKISTIEDKADK